ncbi:MAG: DUF4238 domain-containing protein, partial [Acidobacteria bacterium]|nr:DUF4238 domain-containing protein [Acidobacteriota bacterium]
GRYDFSGGWGNPGSEVIMPVSPQHLLYVQVDKKEENRFVLSGDQTRLLQQLLVQRAHRWVFARQPIVWVSQVKPRLVDRARVTAEKEAWKRWHEEQLQAEAWRPSDSEGKSDT